MTPSPRRHANSRVVVSLRSVLKALSLMTFVLVLLVLFSSEKTTQLSSTSSSRFGRHEEHEHLAHLPSVGVSRIRKRERIIPSAATTTLRWERQSPRMNEAAHDWPTMLSQSTTTTGDEFDAHQENPIKQTSTEPVSTFSVDVDTASYSYVRRLLKKGQMPSSNAVNVEEFINYFDYDYPVPQNKTVPFEPTVAVSNSPWNDGRKLMHIGIKGYTLEPSNRPFSNLVFLMDVSGSMNSSDKLPLAKQAIQMLLKTLLPEDLVSIVTYASNVNVALPPTPAGRQQKILYALGSLVASGATYGEGGIEKAYELAEQNYDKDVVNRVMLITDGDFNVGTSNSKDLQTLIEGKRNKGIFLSVLGVGMGNYKDTTMKALANHGNGVAAYIDTLEEAHKVMVTEAGSTIFPIAKDVKVQVEFNPAMVSEYRLVGYEKRILQREDFNNDRVDAGDIGSGHTVTAIYEFLPVSGSSGRPLVDPLRYGNNVGREMKEELSPSSAVAQEYAFVKIRYKLPKESESQLISRTVTVEDDSSLGGHLRQEFDFATAVAGFAQLLRGRKPNREYGVTFSYEQILQLAERSIGADPHGYRKEFLSLVHLAQEIDSKFRAQTK